MILASATDTAIAAALRHSTLKVTDQAGRFGAFVAISDAYGLIEVCLNRDEARDRVQQVRRALEARTERVVATARSAH